MLQRPGESSGRIENEKDRRERRRIPNAVADANQARWDSFRVEMMKEITSEEPRMWGPTIVGFGDYHYVYESGHEGDMC